MKRILFLAFILIPLVVNTQNHKIDSLRNHLENASQDSLKINDVGELATEFRIITLLDSSAHYAEMQIVLSDKLTGAARMKNKAAGLGSLAIVFAIHAEFNKSLTYFDSAMSLHRSINDQKGVARIYNNKALVLESQGNYSEALICLHKALDINDSMHNEEWTAINYNHIGNIFKLLGNYSEAINYYFKSLRISEIIHSEINTAIASGSIGVVYYIEGDFDKAIENHNRGLQLLLKIGDQYDVAQTHLALASDYRGKNDLDSSLEHCKLAIQILRTLNIPDKIADVNYNMALIYYDKQLYPEALKYTSNALQLLTELGLTNKMPEQYALQAAIFMQTRHYALVEEPLKKAESIALLYRDKRSLKDIYSTFAQLDSVRGDFKNALRHYKLVVTYRDSLNNEENTKKTVRFQMQYDFDKKTATDSIHTAEKKKQDDLKHGQEIAQQKLYTFGGLGGFTLMLIVAIVSIRAFRNKQKANAIISHQKEIVEEKQKEILDSIHYAKRIQQSLLPKEKIIERDIQRMKNN